MSGKMRDPKEVWDNPPYGVEIVNLYFDETPLEWFAGVVCEEGVLSSSEFWTRVSGVGFARRFRDAFGDELA